MPDVDVIDTTWIGVAPRVLAPLVADTAHWRAWWPELDLVVDRLRGVKGVRWFVRANDDTRLSGSMEIYLHPVADGTVAYYFLRLDAAGRRMSRRERERLVRAYRVRAKQLFWQLSDTVDPGRLGRVSAPRTTPRERPG